MYSRSSCGGREISQEDILIYSACRLISHKERRRYICDIFLSIGIYFAGSDTHIIEVPLRITTRILCHSNSYTPSSYYPSRWIGEYGRIRSISSLIPVERNIPTRTRCFHRRIAYEIGSGGWHGSRIHSHDDGGLGLLSEGVLDRIGNSHPTTEAVCRRE